MGSENIEPTDNRKRYLVPGLIGAGMLLLGLVLGFGIAAMVGAGNSPDASPMVVTQLVLVPTQTAYPTFTPQPTSEPVVMVVTPTIFDTPTPEATLNPMFEGVEGVECLPPGAEQQVAQVAQVKSGNEVDVTIDGEFNTVRLLGVQAPDPNNYFSNVARSKSYELMVGKELILVKDVYASDPEGYLPRFVVADGVFVNYDLLREGLARVDEQGSVTSCNELFQTVSEAARSANLGLWEFEPTATPTPTESAESSQTGGITVVDIVRSTAGGGTAPAEYVEIRNDSPEPVQMQFWRLLDTKYNIYSFPQFEMQPGQTCRVYTNEDHPESCGFNWGITDKIIWGTESDCASLSDAMGAIVAQKCY